MENVLILSGITIISGISLLLLNKEKTPKKRSPTPKKRYSVRSPTPEDSPIKEIKTPLYTIRKSPKMPKATPVRSPKVKSPKVNTAPVRSPKVRSPKIIAPIKRTGRVTPIRRSPSEPRVNFGKTRSPTKSILKRTHKRHTRRRMSDDSISSTNATIHTEATDRKNL